MAVKKLIEVALPLEKINAESAREKSIRHGHPSTLHLWWARRPLAAARAVIWASLVDDPSSHPELFPTEEEQNRERQRLFKILEDLVVWENSNNEAVLNLAKAEIMKSTNNNPPALLDPFAGGGAIPLEAQRLGLEAHAHDLNPVAVMINKAMIEIPPRFANRPPVNPEARKRLDFDETNWKGAAGLAEDVRYYGEWMKQEAFKRIGHLYPKVKVPAEQGGGEATVIAWIWARTVKCPNPACGCTMPLASSFVLSKKKGNEFWVKPIPEGDHVSFKVQEGKCPKEYESFKQGRGAAFKCPCCGEITTDEYVKSQGMNHQLGDQLMAIVAEGRKGRIYLSPNEEHVSTASIRMPENYPTGPMPENPRWFSPPAFGMTDYADLFTNRQLKALTTFSDLIAEAQQKVEQDAVIAGLSNDHTPLAESGNGALAYGQAVGIYLAFAVEKAANMWSSIVSWMNDRGAFRETFARQAIPMVWDYAEANPFSNAGGNFTMFLSRCADTVEYFVNPDKTAYVSQFDAQSDCGLRDIMISTDPPYYDNIGYADLSDFFYVWMRRSLRTIYPDLFRTMLVPKAEELIATPYRHDGSTEKAKAFFEDGMLATCRQIYKYSREDIPVTIYYAYKQSDLEESDNTASSGWETMLSAVIQADFSITGTWPVRTESPGRSIAQGTNALASSIVLVCRKRQENAPQTTRRNLINELKRELRPALQKLQASNIAPVDLAQSAIGPGMAVFSKYKKVLESDGSPMSVRSALQIINQELDLYFNEQDSDLDRDSRFCVELYTQSAFNDIKFGDADTLARAKNTSVAALVSKGVLYAQKGVVHLLGRDEIPEDVKPTEDMVWLMTQHLTRGMEKERKGWAQEAYAYNSLVVSWPDIQSRAAQMKAVQAEQISLF